MPQSLGFSSASGSGSSSPDTHNPAKEWRNALLVVVPARLGLNKINKEYHDAVLSFFQCKLNAGIMGGKPS